MLSVNPSVSTILRHESQKLDSKMATLDQECRTLAAMNGQGNRIRVKILAMVKAALFNRQDTPDGKGK